MARHYSDARKNAYRDAENKRREIAESKRQARQDKNYRQKNGL